MKQLENYKPEEFGECKFELNPLVMEKGDNQLKKDIENAFLLFCDKYGCEPRYAICVVKWNDDNGCENVKIKMSADSGEEDDFFFYCNSLPNLKALCNNGCEDFIITQLISFEK